MRLKLDRQPGGTDTAPNTTAPTQFIVTTSETEVMSAFVAAIGGTSVSIRPWAFSETLDQWMALSAAVVCNADTLTSLSDLPRSTKVFFQVTAIDGVTRFGVGVM